jgi:hypothetical protein
MNLSPLRRYGVLGMSLFVLDGFFQRCPSSPGSFCSMYEARWESAVKGSDWQIQTLLLAMKRI